MAFMELEMCGKGKTYCCECAKCGATLYTHEWAYMDHNERRDAMQNGTLRCDHCASGTADAATFEQMRDCYAGRYSASGYLDCTDWEFDANKRRLKQTLREFYGEN